jgi:hypothetical protein
MVAWTNAPRLAALAMVQPDAAGVIPPGPVSWYGVASPAADSGSAGTMMSQLTLAAVVVAGAVVLVVADGVALADVHGAAVAVLVGVAVAVPVAVDVGVAVPVLVDVGVAVAVAVDVAVLVLVDVAVAVGDAVLPGWWPPFQWWPGLWFAAAAGCTYAAGEAQFSAASPTCVVKPSVTATMAPTAATSATGTAMVAAIRRLARLSCRRRHADRCLLGMQSTSLRFFVVGVLFLPPLNSRR